MSNIGDTKVNSASYHEKFFDEVWEKIVKDDEVQCDTSMIPSLREAYEELKAEILDKIEEMKSYILSSEFKQKLKDVYDEYLACSGIDEYYFTPPDEVYLDDFGITSYDDGFSDEEVEGIRIPYIFHEPGSASNWYLWCTLEIAEQEFYIVY